MIITNDVKTWLKWLTTNQPLPAKKGVPFKKAEFLARAKVVVAEYREEKGI